MDDVKCGPSLNESAKILKPTRNSTLNRLNPKPDKVSAFKTPVAPPFHPVAAYKALQP